MGEMEERGEMEEMEERGEMEEMEERGALKSVFREGGSNFFGFCNSHAARCLAI